MASNTLAHLQELDRRHHWHPFTNTKDLNTKGSRMIARAEGCWLETVEGTRLLDGMAGLWCVNVGYGREELARAAYEQMLELPYYNTFFQCSTPMPTELAAKLAALTPHGLDRVFFNNSGSEANDTIVKMVRAYWNISGRPKKKTIIARNMAYHGSTLAAASLCGLKPMQTVFDLPMAGVEHIEPPYWFRLGGDHTPEDFGVLAARWLEDRILALGPDTVAAFIGEPIQGAGGLIVPPESYWPEIQKICDRYDVLLIADEVICGFGRTGNWWGSETFGIRPDFMTLAKGLSSGYVPISAIMVGDRVADALIDWNDEFAHGFTYSGHPVACAVALKNIEILERENLIARVADDIGPYFQDRVRTLLDHRLVGEVRGFGLIAGVELTPDKNTRAQFEKEGRLGTAVRDACTELGIVCRAVRDVMMLSPPLIIARDEVDLLVDTLRRAIDRAAARVGV